MITVASTDQPNREPTDHSLWADSPRSTRIMTIAKTTSNDWWFAAIIGFCAVSLGKSPSAHEHGMPSPDCAHGAFVIRSMSSVINSRVDVHSRAAGC